MVVRKDFGFIKNRFVTDETTIFKSLEVFTSSLNCLKLFQQFSLNVKASSMQICLRSKCYAMRTAVLLLISLYFIFNFFLKNQSRESNL